MMYVFLTLLSVLFMGKSFSEVGSVEEAQWDLRLIAYVLDEDTDRGNLAARVALWREELMDRDVVLVNLGEDELEGYPSLELSEDEKTLWRTLWQMGLEETCFVLVGKDGGPKALQRGSLDPKQFIELIDTMPMRQAEMGRRLIR